MGNDRYTPTGITAQARQHPLLLRTEADNKRIAAAEEKQRRRAARMFKDSATWPEPKPTGSPGKAFAGAEERRQRKRSKK